MHFKEWLKEQILLENRPGTKIGLYPPGYFGIYAPCDWMPYAADILAYAPKEWLNFKFLHTFNAPPLANRTNGVEYISIPYDMPPK